MSVRTDMNQTWRQTAGNARRKPGSPRITTVRPEGRHTVAMQRNPPTLSLMTCGTPPPYPLPRL